MGTGTLFDGKAISSNVSNVVEIGIALGTLTSDMKEV